MVLVDVACTGKGGPGSSRNTAGTRTSATSSEATARRYCVHVDHAVVGRLLKPGSWIEGCDRLEDMASASARLLP